MRLNGKLFAAKTFFNIGKGEGNVSADEINKHLREELVIQKLARNTVKAFSEHAKALHVSIMSACRA